ncbi:MAG TPA: extracellular solute-binding protein [Chloroflexota bacterium]|nr:extracellular solute-binding protein [Chloroflexota bacterium]
MVVAHHWRRACGRGLRARLLAALLIGAAACVGVPTAPPAHAATSLRIWYATDDPTEAPVIQNLVMAFQAAHAGVKVSLTTYGLDDMNAKMQLALSSGNTPDLIYTTPRGPGLPTYVRADKLLDLSAAARRDGWATSLRPGLLSSYNDLLTPTANAAGHVYGAPSMMAIVGVLYNKAIFSRLHLSIPTSLAAFEAACARAKAAGYIPLGLGNADGWVGDDWYLTLVNAIDGPASLVPEQHLDPHFRFTGPAFLQAGALLQTWANQNYFTPQFGGLDAQDGINAFFQGKTAMALISSTENGQIVSLVNRTKIAVGVFAFPSAGGHAAPVMPEAGYSGWAVPRASHQPALAEQFITQMLSSASAQALLNHGLLPARQLSGGQIRGTQGFQRSYLQALAGATPGIYLDGAPISNLNATMEANVQLLLQKFETPAFLTRSLQMVYSSHGTRASSTRTDGEF